ncbi:MAG: pyridoxal phosphate-dependent aminotransferase [Blautia sp.]|jgi:threonine-phosphate decarboxylase
MGKHIHGGDIYRYQNTIDFSSNCNPLGTPKSVKEAVKNSVEDLANYPQVGYETLREAIGQYEGVRPEQVICGNGAAELIFSLCRALLPKRAVLPAPTFAEYEQALKSVGCQVEHYVLKEENGYVLDSSFLEFLKPQVDILFLCNPNNPTGVLIPRELLLKILDRCMENDIFLVVDECFLDFVEQPEAYTLKPYLEKGGRLFLLKAFTKRYAMAGVRLGYGLCGNARLLERMGDCVQPWNLSVMAQEAGLAALKETEYVREGRQRVFAEKAFLKGVLERLGLTFYGSEANYIFFKGPKELWQQALQEGILIRDCGNYPGLNAGYFRIAVKNHRENLVLAAALEKIIKGGQ